MPRRGKSRKPTSDTWNAESVGRRLDAIIHVLLRGSSVQEMSTRDHIELLSRHGLRDVEIAGVLGRTRGYVASELSILRRGGRRRGK